MVNRLFNHFTTEVLLSIILTVLCLVIATYKDVKTREINLWVWLIPLPAVVLNFHNLITKNIIFNTYYIIILVFSLLPAVITLLLALVGLMGGADFLAFLVIGLSSFNIKLFKMLPLPLITFFLTTVIMIIYPLKYFVVNLVKWRKELNKLNLPFHKKVLMAFVGKPVTVGEYLKTKFYYPLTLYKKKGYNVNIHTRLNFEIDEDYQQHINYFHQLLREGLITEDTIVWVTYGVPTVPLILMSYIISLIIYSLNIY